MSADRRRRSTFFAAWLLALAPAWSPQKKEANLSIRLSTRPLTVLVRESSLDRKSVLVRSVPICVESKSGFHVRCQNRRPLESNEGRAGFHRRCQGERRRAAPRPVSDKISIGIRVGRRTCVLDVFVTESERVCRREVVGPQHRARERGLIAVSERGG